MSIGPADDRAQPPKIIALAFEQEGDVIVTWSLPGLRRADVRMSYADWLQGKGLTIGKSLTDMLPPTTPPA